MRQVLLYMSMSRGTEYLATHIRRLSSENPNTFVVSAGDSIGASQLAKASKRDQKSHWVFYPENITLYQ
jgi:2',3'-cyclic-nucleotide 2'-phosphodiesterase (5'-nucleotidase family)